MNNRYFKILLVVALIINFNAFAQEEDDATKSNIQTYTPSKLLDKGQWDIKFFNGLYTQTKSTGENNSKSCLLYTSPSPRD